MHVVLFTQANTTDACTGFFAKPCRGVGVVAAVVGTCAGAGSGPYNCASSRQINGSCVARPAC